MAWWLLLGLLGAGAAGALLLEEKVKGKKFAVLGERSTGKTALINFLTKGTFSTENTQTLIAEKTESNRLELKDLELEIEESKDVPGSEDFYFAWESITETADVVLYLLRVDELMAGNKQTEERVKQDMGQIGKWMKEIPKEFPLFIIGTHCDLTDPDLTKLPKDKKGYYEDKLRGMSIFRDIVLRGGGSNKVRVVFGSLKSKNATEDLVYQVIYQVVHHDE